MGLQCLNVFICAMYISLLLFACICFLVLLSNAYIDQELKQSEPISIPPKPKREITNITNSQNTKRTYGQPSEQLFPKRWPLSNRNRTKINMNTRKPEILEIML